jgi:hypothetical protein
VAVNVTFVPAQVFVEDEMMDTDGVTWGATVIDKLFDVAVVTDVQAALLVSSQLSTSPLARLLEL